MSLDRKQWVGIGLLSGFALLSKKYIDSLEKSSTSSLEPFYDCCWRCIEYGDMKVAVCECGVCEDCEHGRECDVNNAESFEAEEKCGNCGMSDPIALTYFCDMCYGCESCCECKEAESFTPPASAISNAKRGLKLRKKYGRGGLSPIEAKSQGIDSGVTRARKIASGKVSKHDVRRMSAFNRHRKNHRPKKKMADGGPTAGTIAWLLWGGNSGINWAKKKSATMSAESFEAEDSRRQLKKLMRGMGRGEKKRISKMVQLRGIENTLSEVLANSEVLAAPPSFETPEDNDNYDNLDESEWRSRDSCEICARPFRINKFGRNLIQHYLRESDNGLKTWKTKENPEGTRRTARNITGFFLYENGLDALNQYVLFQEKTKISDKVIELLRLSIVERIIAGDVVNLIQMMDMQDEIDDKPIFDDSFKKDFGAESYEAEVCPCGCAMEGCVCSSSCKGECLSAESFGADKCEHPNGWEVIKVLSRDYPVLLEIKCYDCDAQGKVEADMNFSSFEPLNAESFEADEIKIYDPKFKGHDICIECKSPEIPLSSTDGGEIGLIDYYFNCSGCDFGWFVAVRDETNAHEPDTVNVSYEGFIVIDAESFEAEDASVLYVGAQDYSNEIVEKLNPLLRKKLGKTFLTMNTQDDSWMFRLTGLNEKLEWMGDDKDEFIEYLWENEAYGPLDGQGRPDVTSDSYPHPHGIKYVGFDWKDRGNKCIKGFNIPLKDIGYELRRIDEIGHSRYELVKIS